MITCSRCKISTEEYYKSDYYCKECRKKIAKEIRDKNRDERNRKRRERLINESDYRERLSKQKKKAYWNNIQSRMYYSVKSRCKQRDILFLIDIEDIIIPQYCPILGVKLDRNRYSPTLDRIIPSKGYVKGNVQVISKKANTMKNDATFKELRLFCQNVLQYIKSYNDIVQPIEN